MASSLSSGRKEERVTPERNSEFLHWYTCTESPPVEISFSPVTTVEAQEDLEKIALMNFEQVHKTPVASKPPTHCNLHIYLELHS